MFDTVQGDLALFVINPQEDAIVADAVFLKAFEVFGWMFQGEFEDFRMMAEPFQLSYDPRGNVTVQSLQVSIELRSRRYSIHSSFLTSLRGRVCPDKWLARAFRILARNSGSLVSRKSSSSSSNS
jgi:hypothetical protein